MYCRVLMCRLCDFCIGHAVVWLSSLQPPKPPNLNHINMLLVVIWDSTTKFNSDHTVLCYCLSVSSKVMHIHIQTPSKVYALQIVVRCTRHQWQTWVSSGSPQTMSCIHLALFCTFSGCSETSHWLQSRHTCKLPLLVSSILNLTWVLYSLCAPRYGCMHVYLNFLL